MQHGVKGLPEGRGVVAAFVPGFTRGHDPAQAYSQARFQNEEADPEEELESMRDGRQQRAADAFNAHVSNASRSLSQASRCVTEFLGGRDILRRLSRMQAELAGLHAPNARTTDDHDLLPEETQTERSRARRQKRAEERKHKVEANGQTH